MTGGRTARGLTLVEMLFAIIVLGLLVAAVAPALQVAIGRNVVESEFQRLVNDVRFARSEAVKRGTVVNMCRANAAACSVEDPRTCRCRVGVPAKQYEFGWLIYTAPDDRSDFDPDRDELLRVGGRAESGVTMRSNNAIQHRLGFTRAGVIDAGTGGQIAVCQNGQSTEEVPGKMMSFAATGRLATGRIPPGGSCLTSQGPALNAQGNGPSS